MTDKILIERSVVEQALKALSLALSDVDWRKDSPTQPVIHKAYNATCAALEQPQVEQEPVAWCWTGRKGWIEYGPEEHDLYNCDPLYLHPQPPRHPLSEMEIVELRQLTPGTLDVQFVKFTRAIEAAHGIKE